MKDKVESILYLFAFLPSWLQVVTLIWVFVGFVIVLVGVGFYYFERTEVLNIFPNREKTVVPSIDHKDAKEMIIGLSLWAKNNQSFEAASISVKIYRKKEQKFLNIAARVTDDKSEPLQMPLIFKGMKKEDILVHIPILDKDDPETKLRIHFIPLDIRHKITCEIIIVRGLNEYHGAVLYRNRHIEFGTISIGSEEKTEIKFLKKYKKTPEVIITPKEK